MMLLNNVKSAFGEKRQASAKKTQDSNIIERIKESTLNHILSNMNGTQIGPPAVDFSFSESNKGSKRKKTAKEAYSGSSQRPELNYYEVKDEDQVKREFEILSYPAHDYHEVPVICEGCWTFQTDKNDGNLIKCVACNSHIHRQCLFSKDETEDPLKFFNNGFCLRCHTILTEDFALESIRCVFCPLLTGIIVPFYGEFWGHLLCIRYFNLFHNLDKKKNMVFMNTQINALIDNDSVCTVCRNKNGFSVPCIKEDCLTKVHISCGLRKGLIMPSDMQETFNSNGSAGVSSVRFLCSVHCSEKIKSSFLRQRFANMAFGKPKKNSLNHKGTQFYTKEGLIAMGILSENFSRRSSRSPSENRITSDQNQIETTSEKETPNNETPDLKDLKVKAKLPPPLEPELFSLKKDFCRAMNICSKLSFYDIDRLRKTLIDFFHEKGAWVESPRKGVNFEICNDSLPWLKNKTSFIGHKNLWKYLENQIFEKSSFRRLVKLRQRKPKVKNMTQKTSPLPQYEKSLTPPEDPIKRSIERLRNYSPSPKKGVSPKPRRGRRDPVLQSLERNKKPSLSLPKVSLSKEKKSVSYRRKLRKLKYVPHYASKSPHNEPVENDDAFSRSRSRSQSRSMSKETEIKAPINYPKKKKTPIHPFLTMSELLSKAKENYREEDSQEEIAEAHEIDSPHVSEKEIRIMRQINEDKVRKVIAKIDAPGYSIDNKIIYFKDLENVAKRDDVFEDLMGNLFQNNEETTNNNNGVYPDNPLPKETSPPKNNGNVILVHEEEEKAQRMKEDLISRDRLPAFVFPAVDEIGKEEWLEKKWSLSKKPFTGKHVINSVRDSIWENPGDIGRHFLNLKLI